MIDTRTVLFTDLVASTELRVRLGEDRAEELRRFHDELVTSAVTAHGGTVVKGLGDGFLTTFTAATDAVGARSMSSGPSVVTGVPSPRCSSRCGSASVRVT